MKWTIDGKTAQLNGVLSLLNNAKIIFYADSKVVSVMALPNPAAKVENGVMSFLAAESVVLISENPTQAILSAGQDILTLDVGTDIIIEPVTTVEGSILRLKRLIIK